MNRDQDKGIFEKAGEGLDNMATATKNTISNAAASTRDALFGKPESEKDLGDKGHDIKEKAKDCMHSAGEKIEDAGKRVQRESH